MAQSLQEGSAGYTACSVYILSFYVPLPALMQSLAAAISTMPPDRHVLMGFRVRKAELLSVLDCPQLPLHNNEAESDIREYVTRRKISGGTRSEAGRRARDTFVGLKKTCRKLGISFWHFLISRLRGDGQIPPLPDVIRAKALAVT